MKLYSFDVGGERLELVPLAARRALDHAGFKLSLAGWLSLSPDARRTLVSIGSEPVVDVAGLEQLVLSAFAGPFGLIADAGEPVAEGGKRPLFHVAKALAALGGLPSLSVDAGDESRLAILAVRKPGGGIAALAANLTPQPIEVDFSGLAGQGAAVAVLNAESIGSADGWRAASASLQLPPYAVAKIG